MQPLKNQTPAALPEWNLADLYESADSPALRADFERAAREASAFKTDYRGKLADLASDAQASEKLGEAVARYEALQDLLGRIMSFASLLHAGDVTDPARGKFFSDARDKIVDASTQLLFFQLELNRIDDAVLDEAARKTRAGGCLVVVNEWRAGAKGLTSPQYSFARLDGGKDWRRTDARRAPFGAAELSLAVYRRM